MPVPSVPPREPAVLDGPVVRRWLLGAHRGLEAAREQIDAANVYPVADGDTGSNMASTMAAAMRANEEVRGRAAQRRRPAAGSGAGPAPTSARGRRWPTAVADVPDAAAFGTAVVRGALLGARGNSGVILAQALRGVVEVIVERGALDGFGLAAALRRASDLAWEAVAEPAEGTIITVARSAAEAAELAAAGPPAPVARAARAAAAESLRRTPEIMPALAAAGVVDAGGMGYLVLLDALVAALEGDDRASEMPPVVARPAGQALVVRESGSSAYAFEVQYLLDTRADRIASLRRRLVALGDSLAVVGGGELAPDLWSVHVHVNDVGTAIECGIEVGRPHRITVTRFADQIAALPAPAVHPDGAAAVAAAGGPVPAARRRAVVAVVPGRGFADLFGAAGASVVAGGPQQRPSTADLLAAVRAAAATEVVLLPNDGDVRRTAELAATLAREEGIEAVVVPTRSALQGVAAVAVHDENVPLRDDVITMTDAARGARTGGVTVAVRASLTSAGQCQAGDVLGLVDGDVVLIGADVAQVARDLLDRLLGVGGEIVTVATGAGCPPGLADELAARAVADRPFVESGVIFGGQPLYLLLIGVE